MDESTIHSPGTAFSDFKTEKLRSILLKVTRVSNFSFSDYLSGEKSHWISTVNL